MYDFILCSERKLQKNCKLILLIFFYLFFGAVTLSAERHLIYKAKSGDGITTVLDKFFLPSTKNYIDKFKELNANKIDPNDGLYKGTIYKLPIIIKNYNGTDLSSSLNISDDDAQKVDLYNKKVFSANLKSKLYKKDKKIWLPYFLVGSESPVKNSEAAAVETKKDNSSDKKSSDIRESKSELKTISKTETVKTRDKKKSSKKKNKTDYSFLGKKYSKVKIKSTKLSGRVYYIDPGHGGCDPGAIGKRNGHELHEDEYAYDISLRLARRLIENGATVYMIVLDPNDGIRDNDFLKTGDKEYYYGGDTISLNQKERLEKRAEIINELYKQNKKTAKSQTSVTIHLDSRYTEKRIDIFFYYKEASEEGEYLAETLKNTISQKYEEAQPGRGYKGSISSRNLLLLRELKPTAVYIELGNIQNKNDQYRFIKSSNRQTIAQWLCDGLISASKKK